MVVTASVRSLGRKSRVGPHDDLPGLAGESYADEARGACSFQIRSKLNPHGPRNGDRCSVDDFDHLCLD